jgi:CheY-like chemotaxis protein
VGQAGRIDACARWRPSRGGWTNGDTNDALIKGDDGLRTIPVVILTTSEAEADITRSYELNANAYLRKPVTLDAFEALVRSVNDFWLTKVLLPQQAQQ